jgi:hypothetical protein
MLNTRKVRFRSTAVKLAVVEVDPVERTVRPDWMALRLLWDRAGAAQVESAPTNTSCTNL